MYKKIAVVCMNPWETFLPINSQSNAKKYYEWLQEQAVLREVNPYCKEKIELYGDSSSKKQEPLFSEKIEGFQFIYVQTKQKELLEKVLNEADFILVGMPLNREECDRIYLTILPWIEKSIFVWDGRMGKGKDFFRKIQREYKIEEAQIMEMKKLPS